MENKRRKIANVETLETAQPGFANGISVQLANVLNNGEHRSLNAQEKQIIIENAEKAYGDFLTALGVSWKNDPNSMETPRRVAKAYVMDLWAGRYNLPTDITAFPSDGYNGIVLERDIPLFFVIPLLSQQFGVHTNHQSHKQHVSGPDHRDALSGVAVNVFYNTPPALGQDEKDPTHTSNFGVKLQEHCAAKGVRCDLVYPGAPNVRHANATAYLIATLRKP